MLIFIKSKKIGSWEKDFWNRGRSEDVKSNYPRLKFKNQCIRFNILSRRFNIGGIRFNSKGIKFKSGDMGFRSVSQRFSSEQGYFCFFPAETLLGRC